MEVEIANKDGGDVRVQVEVKEGGEGGGVFHVVIEHDDSENRQAITDVSDEKGGVAFEVILGHYTPREQLAVAVMRMVAGVEHDLCALVS